MDFNDPTGGVCWWFGGGGSEEEGTWNGTLGYAVHPGG